MDCPHHEYIAGVVARMERHMNGTHVQQHHVASLQKDVDEVSRSVNELCQTVMDMKHRNEVEKAKRDSTITVLVAAITAAGVIAQALITHFTH